MHDVLSLLWAAAFLDTWHRLIDYAELFFGTVDGAEIHPREVVRQALLLNSAAVVVAHNYPSGNFDPSTADRAVRVQLKLAPALIDVQSLDHIVVARHQTVSLAARG